MRILALDSSSLSASCALLCDGVLEGEGYINRGLTHSETLMPMVEDMLHRTGIALREVDLFATAIGPGSFTGLRIGIAAIKGMAFALDKPCVPVSTLEGLAYTSSLFEGNICPVLDARVGQIYTALFSCHDGVLSRCMPDTATTFLELAECLPAHTLLVGDGAMLAYDKLSGRVEGLRLPPAHLCFQRASGIALAAMHTSPISADALSPVYLRLPQAERERIARENSEPPQLSHH